jgi:hypothetical protein
LVAYQGLQRWRAELTGREKYQVAKNLVLASLRFADEIALARDPWTWPGESASRERDKDESEGLHSTLDEYYARRKRLEQPRNELLKLREATWEADVILDEDVEAIVKPLVESYRGLVSATHIYLQRQVQIGRHNAPTEAEVKQNKEAHETIYSMGEDDFQMRLNDSMSEIKQQMRKYLR